MPISEASHDFNLSKERYALAVQADQTGCEASTDLRFRLGSIIQQMTDLQTLSPTSLLETIDASGAQAKAFAEEGYAALLRGAGDTDNPNLLEIIRNAEGLHQEVPLTSVPLDDGTEIAVSFNVEALQQEVQNNVASMAAQLAALIGLGKTTAQKVGALRSGITLRLERAMVVTNKINTFQQESGLDKA